MPVYPVKMDLTDHPTSRYKTCCNCGFCTCEGCFKRFVEWIIDFRPKAVPQEPEARIWYERGKCTRFDLLFPFFTALVVLVDIALDCKVAINHYRRDDVNWALLTLAFAFVSLVSIEIVSANWFLEDQRTYKMELLKRNGLEIKKWFYICHLLLVGTVPRCYQMFKTVRLIRGIKDPSPANKELYRLYVAQLQDSTTLGVLEAFMEDAPQVALQLYILLQRRGVDWSSVEDLLVVLSITKSLALFALHLLNYARYIRVADEGSRQLSWFSVGSLMYFLWRLFMLISRILALALFASYSPRLVFVVVGLHFAASFLMLCGQECEYFQEEPVKQIFFRCAISYVHVFCFFPLEGKNTRKWGIPYYLLTLVENAVMVLLWNFLTERDLTFRIMALSTEWGTFVIGLSALLSFYCCFHPSHKKHQVVLDKLDSGRGTWTESKQEHCAPSPSDSCHFVSNV